MKSVLFFPLYSGELGWELMVWQGFIRYSAKDFDEVHGVCAPGYEFLYQDIADVLLVTEEPLMRQTVPSFYMSEPAADHLKKLTDSEIHDVKFVDPRLTPGLWARQDLASYKSYKTDTDKKYDAVFHLRNMGHRSKDNDAEEWNKSLVEICAERDKKVALIGTSSGSTKLDIPGVDVFFDKPLSEITEVINSAKIVLGQSSGPMHLAALCEAEIAVWSTSKGEGLKERYETIWNPFKNKVNYFVSPTHGDLLELI